MKKTLRNVRLDDDIIRILGYPIFEAMLKDGKTTLNALQPDGRVLKFQSFAEFKKVYVL